METSYGTNYDLMILRDQNVGAFVRSRIEEKISVFVYVCRANELSIYSCKTRCSFDIPQSLVSDNTLSLNIFRNLSGPCKLMQVSLSIWHRFRYETQLYR